MNGECEQSGASGPSDRLGLAWQELLAAARESGYAVNELINPPALPAQIADSERAIGRRLPSELAALYLLANGQVDWWQLVEGPYGDRQRGYGRLVGSLFGAGWSFDSLQQLEGGYRTWAEVRNSYTAEELATEFDELIEVRGNDPVKKRYTCAGWIPFATDGGGNSLAVDLDPEPGGLVGQVIVIGSDEDLRRVIAPSITALLQLCAARVRAQVASVHSDRGVYLYTLESPAVQDG